MGITSVEEYTAAVRELLVKGHKVKPNAGIEPALTALDFEGGIENMGKIGNGTFTQNNQAHYAAIETAFRNIFYELLAATSIEDPLFSEIWNLLDILSILSDIEQCEPGLVFWLVEELLDSQTIDGCRRVFDYLDSRRERLTTKHFKQKHLIILRACNELLRRLSRAEDTVFCGRVFIFLFQSFPLGDRSSVNLRGEFHVENVTAFDESILNAEHIPETMEVDVEDERDTTDPVEIVSGTTTVQQEVNGTVELEKPESQAKTVKFDADTENLQESIPDINTLYPIFWGLQENFSTPTRLFDTNNFQEFKGGLELTIRKFRAVHNESEARGTSRVTDENKRSTKRKRGSPGDDLSNSINPKYLTSRDLFELEVSDLAFRRHILVQALMLIDFLLSLTPKAKKKLESMTNKSVLYNHTLSEEDSAWATHTRTEIAAYLQQGSEGKFYYRMVDTVLSRDKNWVHWKAEGCPLIERGPVSTEDFLKAKSGAQKACANKRLRVMPLGSLDLTFLSDRQDVDELAKLKDPQRYFIPAVESFREPIAEDDFNMDMAKTDEEKQLASDARASKMWRTLRIASKSRLNSFDRLDDGINLQALFEPQDEENRSKSDSNGTEQPAKIESPQDMTQNSEDMVETVRVPETVVK